MQLSEGLLEGSVTTEDRHDVHVLRGALVTVSEAQLPLCFLNRTNEPITIPEGILYVTLTPSDPGIVGLYHLTEDTSKEDSKALADWQKGPTTKRNYEQQC